MVIIGLKKIKINIVSDLVIWEIKIQLVIICYNLRWLQTGKRSTQELELVIKKWLERLELIASVQYSEARNSVIQNWGKAHSTVIVLA